MADVILGLLLPGVDLFFTSTAVVFAIVSSAMVVDWWPPISPCFIHVFPLVWQQIVGSKELCLLLFCRELLALGVALP
jgi:hypothetical protein